MTKVYFRRVGSRSAHVWVIGTAVVALAVTAYGAVTDSKNRPYALIVPVVFTGFAFVAARHKQWLEVTEDDVALVQRRAFKTVRVGLKDARRIFLRTNYGGSAQIVVDGDGGKAFANLLLATVYTQGYQGEDILAPLIEGAQRNRNPTSGAAATAEILRHQLEHARAGGPVADAPLKELVVDLTGAIGAAGAAGSAASLSDIP